MLHFILKPTLQFCRHRVTMSRLAEREQILGSRYNLLLNRQLSLLGTALAYVLMCTR